MNGAFTEIRPCYVNGERAVFHGWRKEQTVLLNSSRLLKPSAFKEKANLLAKCKIIDGDCEPVIIEETLALVEYADGRVSMVKPDEVRFIDKIINNFVFQFQFDEHYGEIIRNKR